jgi:serine/threonine protein kinase/Tfp pilus assembly protein PilF
VSNDHHPDFQSSEIENTVAAPGGGGPLERIGHYRLLEQIGSGGMGEVHLAEQQQPIRRQVAIKIIKHGMDTKEVVARFESERQALAMMDHPCIAKVFEAGTTERGRPYFVMEYVRGVPITEYCDRHRLDVRARLLLFIQVCEGIQHAHQKAIIHRDIKPSNVLVTLQEQTPLPKIIDFGVAKAMARQLTERTMHTELGQLIGTPEYMSPEQAEMGGQNIDTRTDVYSLGVLLYELLVGALPFPVEELRKHGLVTIQRMIREEDPPRLTARMRTLPVPVAAEVAQRRRTTSKRLHAMLRGDLNWITLKALEKDRSRRYETANGLAMDIRRHLANEPVLAGPPSTYDRVGKFVRRHRTGVAAGALVSLAVLLGIFGTTRGLVRARQAERLASEEAQAARQVSDFLVGLFEVSDPNRSRGNTITAREILDQGADKLTHELADQPATQARLMQTVGRVYKNLGLYEEAGAQLEEALDLRRRPHGGTQHDVATNLVDLASLYIDEARYEEAEPLLQESLRILEAEKGPDHLEVAAGLRNLASIYRRQGWYAEAEPLYERALAIRTKILGPDHPEVAQCLNSLAALHWNEGNYAKAESLYRRALSIWEGALGSNHPDVARGLNNLALLYHQQKRYAEAEPLYRRALGIYEQTLGPDHPRVAMAENNLALVLQDLGRYDEAEPLYERALAVREAALGPEHPDVAQTLNNLANLNRLQGHFLHADSLYTRALNIRVRALGSRHADVGWTLRDLARLHHDRGQLAAADSCYGRALDVLEAALGTDHPDLVDVRQEYASLLRDLGREDEAHSLLARAVSPPEAGADGGFR